MKFTLSTMLPIALLAGLATAQAPSIAAFEATETDVNFQIKVAPALLLIMSIAISTKRPPQQLREPLSDKPLSSLVSVTTQESSATPQRCSLMDRITSQAKSPSTPTSLLFTHFLSDAMFSMTGGSQEGYDFVIDTYYFSGSSSGEAFLPGTGHDQLNDRF
ncbi:hypothetical protein FIBSPDRAFT_990403 [Athelia psychrophila]|uniref:Glycoside hydrolase family 16 protein n=1 Tax=Athelia psychrophila TaxID=1759441 RepID=A0A166WR78_9AGAM|nr:hypothetical protein FIBSPDRAFT_990403 [Fibularhizoctonia sp. CBS 109695]